MSALMTSIQCHFSNLQVQNENEVADAICSCLRLSDKVNVPVHFTMHGSVGGRSHSMTVHMRDYDINSQQSVLAKNVAAKVVSDFNQLRINSWPFA